MSTEPYTPDGNELAPEEVLRLYGMRPHSAKKLIAKIEAYALREAAGGVTEIDGRRDDAAATWLNDRADRIEAGEA